MNISENKRVVALSALFAIAFGGICYIGVTRMQDAAAAQKELTDINNRFEDYGNAEVPPTRKNRDALKVAYAQVNQVNADLQKQIEHYAAACYGDGKAQTAQDFQSQLKNDIDKIAALAKEKGTTISSPAADLGMSGFKNSPPVADDVPFRAFQHRAVMRVAEDIINAGATTLDKVFCATLPDEAQDAAKGSKKAAPYFPLSFEVAFEGKRGCIPAVINSIVSDKDMLLTITGIAVKGSEDLPGIEAYQAPTATPAGGEDIGSAAAASAEAAAPAVRTVARRLTGNPDDTARVHLNLQVLYFNPSKNK